MPTLPTAPLASRSARLRASVFAALLAAPLLVTGCDSGDDDASGAEVRVMSQNLYLGGDLFTVTAETDAQRVPLRVAELYATIEASDPAARMAAIAAEIADIEPDLVGLQEVATYAVQTPADNLPGGAATAATDVTYDLLDLLLDALAAEGASYTVAARSDNADVEFPATADGRTFFDVRYRDADVILARSGVETSGATATVFQAILTVPVGGVEQAFVRSYQSVRATVDGATFAFFNTHLEVGGPAGPVQEAQGAELAAAVARVPSPLVLVGDLNSDAGGTGTATYGIVTRVLDDAAGAGAGTPTCCQDADLRNDASDLSTRIDLVLTRGFQVEAFETVLDEPADRIGDLWPSDHAGVWADLVLGDDA
ncbi:endonuclease/exonuclease/phosphatase family protein [Rubrivirga sp. S365]|uniref:Endonuclease/exonuclease/phosphatase family protein n=1 Tax=Rubrivirga litoralis TaxID=3075598 RepID=A0ABU3BRI2_9BACT|nr:MULTISPECIES: endonuclease/exonuclease/phosphatase family protein [unclassified Rubrivirga]MDT0631892.1 endonuclease/exonuclease/phosphatase family protein [Rubrivirga sp. F394]MDT7857945.1 endonuclease/exonuclease/phosphatase family protein [Rubrivirga sp. S365]